MIDFVLTSRFPGYVDACDTIEEALKDGLGDEPYEEAVQNAIWSAALAPWTGDCWLTFEQHNELRQALEFEKELNTKSDAEIRFVSAEIAAAEQTKLGATLSDKEHWQFFNERRARADFDHWGIMARWSVEETVSLCLGKAPTVVNSKSLGPLAGRSAFAGRYAELLDLVQRAADAGELGNPVEPELLVTWSKRVGIEIPPELEAAVRRRSTAMKAVDTSHALLIEERDALVREKEIAEQRVQELEGLLRERDLRVRERKTLLGIIIGMAVAKYRYDPEAMKSPVPGRIAGHVQHLGFQIGDETVREKLKEAARLIETPTE